MFLNEAHAGHLPIQASDVAESWDTLYLFLIWLSIFFFVLVIGGMIYFAVKYRASANPRPTYITGSHLIEAAWAIIPTILLMIIFVWGYVVYNRMTQAPGDAYEVKVIGKQWSWDFQYEDGRITNNELFVPINRPVRLIMSSQDVIHSFFVPNFRIKQDVVPGMYTSVWFEATVAGKHQIYCTEYCGTGHSLMLGKVVVLDDQQWELWRRGRELPPIPDAADGAGQLPVAKEEAGKPTLKKDGAAPASLAERGKKLTELKGCIACHTTTGAVLMGPSFKGVYGHEVELADGSKVKADENYLRESILEPQAKLVKGFGPVMPSFKGQLKEEELNAIIAYIKTLK